MDRSEVPEQCILAGVIDTCNSQERDQFPAALTELLHVCAALGISTPSSEKALKESLTGFARPFDFERVMMVFFAETQVGFIVSRSLTGQSVATVFHSELFDEMTFHSQDLALAMLGAVTAAFIGSLENPAN